MGKRVASAVHRRDWSSLFNRAVVRGSRAPAGLVIAVLVALLVASWVLVYTTGGTRSALPHLFYLPIILAALSFGLRGAVATALVATVVSGPAIPLDVATGDGTFHRVFQPIYSLTDDTLLAVGAPTRFDVLPYRTPDLWFAAAAHAGR